MVTLTKLSDREFADLLARADQAGFEAGRASVPEPMHVVQRANPFDDRSPVVKAYAPVMDGVCGFAWIHFPDARASVVRKVEKQFGRAARMAVREGRKVREDLGDLYGGKAYGGGYDLSVGAFNQSMTRKQAYAAAFAEVFRAAGIDCYAQSRMD